MNKIPGLYNEHCTVEVEPVNDSTVAPYDYFNLTATMRTQFLQNQFEVLEQLFKDDLKVDEFCEFTEPIQESVFLCGRIVNLSNEDSTLAQDCVGLFNLGDENTSSSKYRLKLNLAELNQEYSVFEGEVVVAMGFFDANNKFNVKNLKKLAVRPPQELYDYSYLKRFNEL